MQNLQHAVTGDDVSKIVAGICVDRLLVHGLHHNLWLLWSHGAVEHVKCGDGRLVFNRKVYKRDEVSPIIWVTSPDIIFTAGLIFVIFIGLRHIYL